MHERSLLCPSPTKESQSHMSLGQGVASYGVGRLGVLATPLAENSAEEELARLWQSCAFLLDASCSTGQCRSPHMNVLVYENCLLVSARAAERAGAGTGCTSKFWGLGKGRSAGPEAEAP